VKHCSVCPVRLSAQHCPLYGRRCPASLLCGRDIAGGLRLSDSAPFVRAHPGIADVRDAHRRSLCPAALEAAPVELPTTGLVHVAIRVRLRRSCDGLARLTSSIACRKCPRDIRGHAAPYQIGLARGAHILGSYLLSIALAKRINL